MILGDPTERVDGGNVRVGTTPELMEDTVLPGDIVLNHQPLRDPAVCRGVRRPLPHHLLQRAHLAPRDRLCRAAQLRDHHHAVRHLCRRAARLDVHPRARQDALRGHPQGERQHRDRRRAQDDGALPPTASSPSSTRTASTWASSAPPNLLSAKKKHVILVDHNERSQSVEGPRAGGDHGDHRPPPHRLHRDRGPRLLPQHAPWAAPARSST